MMDTTTDVTAIEPIDGEEAAALASAEYERMLGVLRGLEPEDWGRQTPCEAWDVRALVGHLVGSLEQYASTRAAIGNEIRARRRARRTGESHMDAWTGLQVDDQAGRAPQELVERFDALRESAVRGRMRLPRPLRRMKADDGLGNALTLGDVMRVVATRDSWMHRDDLARTTGREMTLTPGHDGRIVADVVGEWATRHGQPFTLRLTGPAGGSFRAGDGGPSLELDAVELCRALSGRASGDGLLAQGVPF